MNRNISDIINQTRKNYGMTQEEFASRLGVTPQAISRWERGTGLPDTSLLSGICQVLHIDANTLLDIKSNCVVENNDSKMDKEIKNNAIAEPLLIELGLGLVSCFIAGLKTEYINTCRKNLAATTGIILPILRIKDCLDIQDNEFRILSYDTVLHEEVIDTINESTYNYIIDKTIEQCKKHYSKIINKQLVKILIDNLKEQYSGIADGLIPEKISYLKMANILKCEYEKNGNIRNLIRIIEDAEQRLQD